MKLRILASLLVVIALAALYSGGCTVGPDGSCLPDGDPCASDLDCCGGFCDASGTCGGSACGVDGDGCNTDLDCCSGFCDSTGTCGCAVGGDGCNTDSDCCSGFCDPSGTCG